MKICPGCEKQSIYNPELDRYFHADGSDNKSCWRELLRGNAKFLAVERERAGDLVGDFLRSRAEWLEVIAVDKSDGSFDIALVIDGTYTPHSHYDKDGLVGLFKKILKDAFERTSSAGVSEPGPLVKGI